MSVCALAVVFVCVYLDVSLRLHHGAHHSEGRQEAGLLSDGGGAGDESGHYGVVWAFTAGDAVAVVTTQRKTSTPILRE